MIKMKKQIVNKKGWGRGFVQKIFLKGISVKGERRENQSVSSISRRDGALNQGFENSHLSARHVVSEQG